MDSHSVIVNALVVTPVEEELASDGQNNDTNIICEPPTSLGTDKELPHELTNDNFSDVYGVHSLRELRGIDLQSWVDVIEDEVEEYGALKIAMLLQELFGEAYPDE